MNLVELASVELVYQRLDVVVYGTDAQYYGRLEGSLDGERLSGSLTLTNLAKGRSDDVNQPTLRGVLTTPDATTIWVELDGIATSRPEDGARVFVTSARFRTGAGTFSWVNRILGVLEGVLDTETGVARGRLYECRPTGPDAPNVGSASSPG